MNEKESSFNFSETLETSNSNDDKEKIEKNDNEVENDNVHDNDDENYRIQPTISILNVIVDYVMSSPTPFEPEEYQWKQLQKQHYYNQQQQQYLMTHHQQQHNNEDDDNDSNAGRIETEYDTNRMIDYNENVQVPIIRIFGPIVRGKRLDYHLKNHYDLNENEQEKTEDNDDDDNKKKKDHLTTTSTTIESTPPSSFKINHEDSQSSTITTPVTQTSKSTNVYKNTKSTTSSTTTTTSSNDVIHQSGCLHIHGAYPYLLARPIKAGADASSCFDTTASSLSSKDTTTTSTTSSTTEEKNVKNDENKCIDDNDDHDARSSDYNNDNDHDDDNVVDDDEVIDWDDEQSVSTIIDDIHVQLEAALQKSVEEYSNTTTTSTTTNITNNNETPNITNQGMATNSSSTTNLHSNHHDAFISPSLSSLPTRFIRKITIVRGRGFYTYCVGSAAPFLRIEYYNPANRWRVKVMLERGLELPLNYHPCSRINSGRNGSGGNTANCDEVGVGGENELQLLSFRCYEAHIPYTMQFFKVSYIYSRAHHAECIKKLSGMNVHIR